MRIIGIKILEGNGRRKKSPVEVMKGLKPGWFPFGDFQEPVKRDDKWILVNGHENYGLYQLCDNMPHIEVCGVVGMNGSGKSTIIDYLLMIINNVAYYLLPDNYASDEAKPAYANNVYAKLYFETDGCIYRIKCENRNIFLSERGRDIPLMERHTNEHKRHERREILSKLFYTVICNYGAYSLNANEYKNGKWLDCIFELEQNYIFPITITPNRIKGNFDVNRIKEEAMDKLVALMMYSQVKGNSFMSGYKPTRIDYIFDEELRNTLTDKIGVTARGKNVAKDNLASIKSAILSQWARLTECEGFYLQDRVVGKESEEHEILGMLLEYMAFETVHLCVYYDRFRRIFDPIEYIKNKVKTHEPILLGDLVELLDRTLFDTIINNNSNLTYGIRKCWKAIKESKNRGYHYHLFFRKKGTFPVAKFKLPPYPSIEDVLDLLPPPIFKMDVLLKREDSDDIQISKMSSGERQWLYSLTTALFHIKYVDDTIARTKDIHYNHVCLIFDEAELYYHPEYQRDFVYNLLQYISWLNLGWINSIQVIIATHSPFILSDITSDNILFLKGGQDYRMLMTEKEKREFAEKGTFGANYYELLRNSFFLEDNAIGKHAVTQIEKVINIYREKDIPKRQKEYQKNKAMFRGLCKVIGDDYLRGVVVKMVMDLDNEFEQ